MDVENIIINSEKKWEVKDFKPPQYGNYIDSPRHGVSFVDEFYIEDSSNFNCNKAKKVTFILRKLGWNSLGEICGDFLFDGNFGAMWCKKGGSSSSIPGQGPFYGIRYVIGFAQKGDKIIGKTLDFTGYSGNIIYSLESLNKGILIVKYNHRIGSGIQKDNFSKKEFDLKKILGC